MLRDVDALCALVRSKLAESLRAADRVKWGALKPKAKAELWAIVEPVTEADRAIRAAEVSHAPAIAARSAPRQFEVRGTVEDLWSRVERLEAERAAEARASRPRAPSARRRPT